MFIIAVLSFVAGIYLQTIFNLSPFPIIISLFAIITLIPFIFSKKRRLTVVLILICFCIAGMLRIETALSGKQDNIASEEIIFFEGTILESSRQIKTVVLSSPLPLKGTKAVFRTEDNLGISDTVRLSGQIRELDPTFKNPSVTS